MKTYKEFLTEKEMVTVDGSKYVVLAKFNTDKDANKYLEKNKKTGVITIKDGVIYVAALSDKGTK